MASSRRAVGLMATVSSTSWPLSLTFSADAFCPMDSFSLRIESVKLCGVEPRAYQQKVTVRAVRNSGTVTLARDFTRLLVCAPRI